MSSEFSLQDNYERVKEQDRESTRLNFGVRDVPERKEKASFVENVEAQRNEIWTAHAWEAATRAPIRILNDFLIDSDFDDVTPSNVPLPDQNYDWRSGISPDLIEYAADYMLTTNPEEAQAVTMQLRDQVDAKSRLGEQGLFGGIGYGLVAAPLTGDLTAVFLPALKFGKSVFLGSKIAQSAATAGAQAAFYSAANETIMHQFDLDPTRTAEESGYNIGANMILSLSLGGVGGAFANTVAGRSMKKEIQGIMSGADDGPKTIAQMGDSVGAMRSSFMQTEGNSLAQLPPAVASVATMNSSPMIRLLNQVDYPEAQWVGANLFDNALRLEKNGAESDFQVSTHPVERIMDNDFKGVQRLLLGIDAKFKNQAGLGNAYFARGRSSIEGASVGRKEGTYNIKDFNRAVSEAYQDPDFYHENIEVSEAAKMAYHDFFKPYGDSLVELGVINKLNEGFFGRYLPRIPDAKGILANRIDFENVIYKNYKIQDQQIASLEAQVRPLEKQIASLENKVKTLSKKGKETPSLGKKKTELEALKKVHKDMVPAHLKNDKGLLHYRGEEDYLREQASSTVDSYLTLSDEAVLNLAMISNNSQKTRIGKARTVMIPDSELAPFMIRDIQKLIQSFSRAAIPARRLTEMAHDLHLSSIEEVQKELLSKMADRHSNLAGSLTGKTAEKQHEKFKKAEADIKASFDILKGVYGLGMNVYEGKMASFAQTVQQYQYITKMGGIAAYTPTDAMHVALKYGLSNTLRTGYSSWVKQSASWKHNKSLLEDMNYGLNHALGTLAKNYVDGNGLNMNPGLVRRSVNWVQTGFSNVNLNNGITDFLETVAGNVIISGLAKKAHRFSTGKAKPKEISEMVAAGLSKDKAKIINEQWKKHGGKSDGGFYLNHTDWDIEVPEVATALNDFKLAVSGQLNASIIRVSKGDVPLLSHHPLASMLFQFKKFFMAASTKLILPAMQKHDREVLGGVIAMMTMGMAVTEIKAGLRGQEAPEDWDEMFVAALDNSTLLGLLTLGVGPMQQYGLLPGSTYYDRNPLLKLLVGPSADLLDTTAKSAVRAGEIVLGDDLTEQDLKRFAKMLPYNNVIGMNKLLQTGIENVAN